MEDRIGFSDVLRLLERHGWKLHKIDPPYRIFMKGQELPILIPVHEKQVEVVYVEKIKKILGIEGELEDDA